VENCKQSSRFIQLFTADAIGNTVIYPSQPHFHTRHGAALNKVYRTMVSNIETDVIKHAAR